MKHKIYLLLFIISLSVTLSMMSNTYSRYVAGTTGDLEVSFAKWQILVNETDITSSSSKNIDLTPTMIENENIKDNTIAPTSEGYVDILIDPSNVNVSFNYEIKLEYDTNVIPDLLITKYAILDSDYTNGDEIEYITLNDYTINNTINYNEEKYYESFTVRIYFQWYDGDDNTMSDEDDTIVGKNAATGDKENISITANIKFEQAI